MHWIISDVEKRVTLFHKHGVKSVILSESFSSKGLGNFECMTSSRKKDALISVSPYNKIEGGLLLRVIQQNNDP